MEVIDKIIKLSGPQLHLVNSRKQFPGFVGGFGSGKTEALINRAIKYKLTSPECNIAYYMPTYDLVSVMGFPRFEAKLDAMGFDFETRTGTNPRIMVREAGDIIFRTMNRPERIIAYEVADSFVDEIDTLKEKDAKDVWGRILSRNRQKKNNGQKNTAAIATTPEGFKFVYQNWKNKPPSEEYELIKASSYSNKHLQEGYIQSLIDLYPSQLVEAYINGEFVNLAQGSVYPKFDRVLNGCNTQINTLAKEPLHIGQDFNVGKMASIICVLRGNNEPHAVGELCNVFDTPTTITLLQQRFPGHPIIIYPDASGNARKSNQASQSDIALFTAAKMNVFVNNVNPFIKDRVLSVNVMICNGKEERKLKVNINNCPILVESLEKQAYDENGEPDKTSNLDHPIDALGYFIAYRYPVLSGQRQRVEIGGR